ncbi:glycosyltransferase family A protein [Clostridium beijerinckii]|uniref:Putative glycosyltransferase EpsH n=1 Tax=Clostridium beijerinckii TaxID=1520 RepID=A0A1S8S685_CLOBE|nr:glycosyltransferase family A protein [Clostridium beijerinckii]NRY60053.1 glycosyltransferase involved in cell wall biosynthesis [Clostridium beijerinckii]OOM60909.1 putative glycosyltransferase EpsH [Clostridium beijerinckii]
MEREESQVCIVISYYFRNIKFEENLLKIINQISIENNLTIIFSCEDNVEKLKNIIEKQSSKIKLLNIKEIEEFKELDGKRLNGISKDGKRSYALFNYFSRNLYDSILFMDRGGHAFHSIQAKNVGIAFNNTKIILLGCGTRRYENENNLEFNNDPLWDSLVEWCEEYCYKNSDKVIMFFEDIVNWLHKQKIKCNDIKLLDEILEKENKFSEVIFFDERLERKIVTKDEKLVSICVPYYNHGKYLPYVLESINENSYKNIEVIVVNDGSTDEYSINVFEEMKKKYNMNNWKFLEKENGYLGQTRNYAVKHSNGEYIIFVDSDNICKKDMVKIFVKCLEFTNYDCLTCYFDAFTELEGVTNTTKVAYKYMPVGPVLEVGYLLNVFGDANFIVKRKVFDIVGGFTEERNLGWEDWEFLIKLNILGYKHNVIPKSLFWYRHLEDSMARIIDDYKNFNRILRPYVDLMGKIESKTVEKILKSMTIPLYYAGLEQQKKLNEFYDKITGKKIIIFGTGDGAERITRCLNCEIIYFVDNNQMKWGAMFLNKEIKSPNELKNENAEEVSIIVASIYYDDISEQLNAMGFKEEENYWNGLKIIKPPMSRKLK